MNAVEDTVNLVNLEFDRIFIGQSSITGVCNPINDTIPTSTPIAQLTTEELVAVQQALLNLFNRL